MLEVQPGHEARFLQCAYESVEPESVDEGAHEPGVKPYPGKEYAPVVRMIIVEPDLESEVEAPDQQQEQQQEQQQDQEVTRPSSQDHAEELQEPGHEHGTPKDDGVTLRLTLDLHLPTAAVSCLSLFATAVVAGVITATGINALCFPR
jgi:hypothetical protein